MASRETRKAQLSRYTIRQQAEKEIETFERAKTETWASLQLIQKPCPCCGHATWDKESPEWSNFQDAHDAFVRAIAERVAKGEIAQALALQKFDVRRVELEGAIVRYKRENMTVPDEQPDQPE